MDAPASSSVDRSQLTGLEKLLHDVEVAIQGPLRDLPLSKPWQRALVSHLEEASRCLQVLRLTRAMARPAAEVAEAAQKLSGAMRAVHAYVQPSRADMGTKATIHIGSGLAQRLAAELVTPQHEDQGP